MSHFFFALTGLVFAQCHIFALHCIARHIALQAGRKLKKHLGFFFPPILLGFFSSIYLQLCRSTATPLRATNLIPFLAEVPALTKDFLDARSKSVCFMRAHLLTATFSQRERDGRCVESWRTCHQTAPRKSNGPEFSPFARKGATCSRFMMILIWHFISPHAPAVHALPVSLASTCSPKTCGSGYLRTPSCPWVWVDIADSFLSAPLVMNRWHVHGCPPTLRPSWVGLQHPRCRMSTDRKWMDEVVPVESKASYLTTTTLPDFYLCSGLCRPHSLQQMHICQVGKRKEKRKKKTLPNSLKVYHRSLTHLPRTCLVPTPPAGVWAALPQFKDGGSHSLRGKNCDADSEKKNLVHFLCIRFF